MIHEFRLKLIPKKLDKSYPSAMVIDTLYEHGCSDALISWDYTGIYVDFSREASTLEGALSSAFDDVSGLGYESMYVYK